MTDGKDAIAEELADLKRELDNFQKEKERVRAILGNIGGAPQSRTQLINNLFIAIVAISVVVSVIVPNKWQLLMIEVATVTLSIKIIYLMHYQMRVNHFQFWILSSIEWRINEMISMLRRAEHHRKSG